MLGLTAGAPQYNLFSLSQVQQQRQLKQQNQATLAALQQNAVANQQQLADLQRNVTQLQQLEQNILAQQSTPHNQQQQQLQVRVQQILQQKQQLQQQIKQFQQQVEQQLAYTQHAGPQLLPPPLQQGQAGGKKEAEQEFLEDSSAITSVSASDLNFLMCADQLQGFMASPGKLRVPR